MINLIKKFVRRKIYYKGPYKNWAIAKDNSVGYDSKEILQKVTKSALYVKNTKKGYERDSVISYQIDIDEYLLKIFQNYSDKKNKSINILDFGGSLGSLYFKYKDKIKNKFNWSIIEQKNFVIEGKKNFQNNELNFFNNIEEYKNIFLPNIIIASSSLQYLERYQELLKDMLNLKPDYIVVLKTPFSEKMFDEIYIQKPGKNIYKSTYPSWIFSYKSFLNILNENYTLEEKKITKPEIFRLKYLDLYFKRKKINYE